MFRFIWTSGFREEEFFLIDQSETRIACGGHVCKRIGTKCAIFIEDLPYGRCFLPSFGSFGQAVSEETIFYKLINQKEEKIFRN
jgi:hypothetical protein